MAVALRPIVQPRTLSVPTGFELRSVDLALLMSLSMSCETMLVLQSEESSKERSSSHFDAATGVNGPKGAKERSRSPKCGSLT